MDAPADHLANNYTFEIFALVISAIAYYLGAYIRHKVQPNTQISFGKQALMGIPLFLALAATLLTAVATATQASSGAIAQTLGVLLIFLENGLVINEAWAKLLQRLMNGDHDQAPSYP